MELKLKSWTCGPEFENNGDSKYLQQKGTENAG